jgi:small GTP-binding protein
MIKTNEKPKVDFIWKLVFGGNSGVGKTCLLHRYLSDEFTKDLGMTIGAQFDTQFLKRQGYKIILILWDFSGQERFNFILNDYIHGAAGAFIMFDMSCIQTLSEVSKWAKLIKNNSRKDIPIVLLGGKCDLVSEESMEKINGIAVRISQENECISYIPTSSLIGSDVNEAIMYMVDYLIAKNA